MAGQVVVHVSLGPAHVVIGCEDVGYSPDVIDDLRVRAIDTLHQALHMTGCQPEVEVLTEEELMARLMGDDDGRD